MTHIYMLWTDMPELLHCTCMTVYTYQFWVDVIQVPFEGFTGEMFTERDSIRDVSIIHSLCLRSLFEEILLEVESLLQQNKWVRGRK